MFKIHNWCMRHQKLTILFGFIIIFFGILINYHWNESHDTILSAISHLLIIFGEAVVVMFFLHIWVEAKNHHDHMLESSRIIDNLQSQTLRLITDQTTRSQELFNETLLSIQKQAGLTTDQIKTDLFEALLKDKMPAEMVRQMLDSTLFKPTFLRRNLDITYSFDHIENNYLVLKVDIHFDIEYSIGNEKQIDYEMPFSLSDSPIATYKLKEASYRRYINSELDTKIIRFTEDSTDFLKKEFGPKKEKDEFTLNQKITLSRNERIKVYQTIEVKYNLSYPAVLDSYYVNHHTLSTTIRIDLPKEYEFVLYPSFPEKDLPTPIYIAGKPVYENIKLLIPGQGWGYSILRKD